MAKYDSIERWENIDTSISQFPGMPEFDVPHEMILSFLEQKDPNIRRDYNEYKRARLNPLPDVSRTSLDSLRKNEVFPLLLKSEIAAQQVSDRRPDMMPTDSLSAMGFCFFLDVLEDAGIVNPFGDRLSKSLVDLYGEEIVNDPESFWDVYFEMEVAHHFVLNDLEAYPIDESTISGPGSDVFYKAPGREYWVECKNKRQSTSYEWELERLGREISDSLWTEHGMEGVVEEDSFAVRISSDQDISEDLIKDQDLRLGLIDKLGSELAELIGDRGSATEISYDGVDFDLELVSYHAGRYEITLSDDGMEALENRANLAKITNPYQHLGINPDILETNGHGTVYAEKTGDRTLEIFSTYAFILDIPWDIPYHTWVYSTIDGVTAQFPDYPDIIIFVKIPPGIIHQMMNETTVNHKGEEVSKWHRLEERIIGLYSDPNRSNRVKSVVLSTDVVIDKMTDEGRNIMLQNAVKPVYNENASEDIPGEFVSMVEDMNKIDVRFQKPGIFSLRDQHL